MSVSLIEWDILVIPACDGACVCMYVCVCMPNFTQLEYVRV